ncbi:hypothetical protein BC834DRAFT_261813 [Gloeopeniophorella convolvens]|nr:hypothetical protein BC834DRAFT_261813 [Gloeopeniophorella convolvens]
MYNTNQTSISEPHVQAVPQTLAIIPYTRGCSFSHRCSLVAQRVRPVHSFGLLATTTISTTYRHCLARLVVLSLLISVLRVHLFVLFVFRASSLVSVCEFSVAYLLWIASAPERGVRCAGRAVLHRAYQSQVCVDRCLDCRDSCFERGLSETRDVAWLSQKRLRLVALTAPQNKRARPALLQLAGQCRV